MAQGESYTGQVYLGADATARSVRTVTGVPGVLTPTPVAGDLALSSNGSAYLYSGAAWQSLVGGAGGGAAPRGGQKTGGLGGGAEENK